MVNERVAKDGAGFDQLNAEPVENTFVWDAAAGWWRAKTVGQQAGLKEPFARALIRTDNLAEGDTVWAGVEFLIPAATYSALSRWLDGPLRGINWRSYPGAKDNTGFAFDVGYSGASGDMVCASWRDGNPSRQHGRVPKPGAGVWHRAEMMVRFSRADPLTRLFFDGREIPLPGARLAVYDWSRPFVMNDWQFGLVGTSGNPAGLEMLVRSAYVSPRQVWAATPAPPVPEPDLVAVPVSEVVALLRADIGYWRGRKQSWAAVKASPGGKFYYSNGGS